MRKFKSFISVICVIVMLLAAGFVPVNNSNVSASTYNETLTEIYPADFGIEDGIKMYTTFNTMKDNASLVGTIFTADIKHVGSDFWLMYAAWPDAWNGLRFGFNDGTLFFTNTFGVVQFVTFYPEIAGVNFTDELFRLQISIEACNSDNDGKTDDVKLGIYFNYKLYNNKYLYLVDALDKLGNSISAILNPTGKADYFGYWNVFSPIKENNKNHLNISPADFGFNDGFVNASKPLNMDIGNKLLSADVSLNNSDDYFDYAGIKLSTNATGALMLSDSTGKNSFASSTNQPNYTYSGTDLTSTDIGIASGVYEHNGNAFSATGVYSSYDNTRYSVDITPDLAEGRFVELRHAGSTVDGGWTAILVQVYADKIDVSFPDPAIPTYQRIYASDVGLTTFNKQTFTLGIALDYCDYDNDADNNDVEVGIWVNNTFVSNKLLYLPDIASRLGVYSSIYIPDDSGNTKLGLATSLKTEDKVEENPIDLTSFNLQIATKARDYDADGKSDLKADLYLDDVFYKSVLISNYKTKLKATFDIKATVKSDIRKISYSIDTFGYEGLTFNGGKAYTSLNISKGKVFSSNVSLKDNTSKLGFSLSSNASSFASGDRIFSIEITSNGTNPVISGLFSKTLTDISLNESFGIDIELRAVNLDNDINNDISVVVLINGKPIDNRSFFIRNAANTAITNAIAEFTKTNVKSSKRLPEDALEATVYNLHEGDYILFADGEAKINRKAGHVPGEKISTPGEYVIIREYGGKEYTEKVHLWKAGYINADDEIDILDFVAAIKHMAGIDNFAYRAKGADVDFDGEVTSSDIIKIKRIILGLSNAPVFNDYDKYSTVGEGTMPIVGFHGPLPDGIFYDGENGKTYHTYNNTTDKVYKAIADVGVNLIAYFDPVGFDKAVYKNLELAEKYGVDMLVNYQNASITDAQFARYTGSAAHYKSFKGFFVIDEPHTAAFGSGTPDRLMANYAPHSRRVNKYTNVFGYTNLFPMYSFLAPNTPIEELDSVYYDYVDEYCRTYDPKMVSWDNYVFSTQNKEYYFRNINVVKDTASKYNIPFWGFIQAGDTDTRDKVKKPLVVTDGEMQWNVNTQLAYGAKGIQYFSLVQPFYLSYDPSDDTFFNFNHRGLIGANGENTQYYPMAKKANEQIAAVDEYLMNADSKAVLAKGTKAQRDTGITAASYGSLASISCSSSTNGAIVGCFDYRGKEAFYVVNYNTSSSQTIILDFKQRKTLSVISSNLNTNANSNYYAVNLGAGEAVLVIVD